jgi:two-component system invasion response regulator UvrY
MRRVRVFVADDHAIVRRGLCALIADTEDLEVVGEASTGDEVVAAIAGGEPHCDVLVLDLSVARSGVQTLSRLFDNQPELAILVLSVVADPVTIERLLAQGVMGYVTKDTDPDAIIAAIRAVARHEAVVPEGVRTPAPGEFREPHEQLSGREREVFDLVLQHRSPGEIGALLDLTPSTVSTFLARIRKKLGARTNTDMVDYAHRVGLLPLSRR